MQEITKKIKDEALKKFEPVIRELAQQGKTPDEIAIVFRNHVDRKVKEFYNPIGLERAGTLVSKIGIQDEDSKAEAIFYSMLCDSGLKFKFQVQIGFYRVDYLINNSLIVELDGRQHKQERDEKRDKYLCDLGYQIIRVPIWILAIDKDAIIETIVEAAQENWKNQKPVKAKKAAKK